MLLWVSWSYTHWKFFGFKRNWVMRCTLTIAIQGHLFFSCKITYWGYRSIVALIWHLTKTRNRSSFRLIVLFLVNLSWETGSLPQERLSFDLINEGWCFWLSYVVVSIFGSCAEEADLAAFWVETIYSICENIDVVLVIFLLKIIRVNRIWILVLLLVLLKLMCWSVIRMT